MVPLHPVNVLSIWAESRMKVEVCIFRRNLADFGLGIDGRNGIHYLAMLAVELLYGKD